jgi:hypothetical protein
MRKSRQVNAVLFGRQRLYVSTNSSEYDRSIARLHPLASFDIVQPKGFVLGSGKQKIALVVESQSGDVMRHRVSAWSSRCFFRFYSALENSGRLQPLLKSSSSVECLHVQQELRRTMIFSSSPTCGTEAEPDVGGLAMLGCRVLWRSEVFIEKIRTNVSVWYISVRIQLRIQLWLESREDQVAISSKWSALEVVFEIANVIRHKHFPPYHNSHM